MKIKSRVSFIALISSRLERLLTLTLTPTPASDPNCSQNREALEHTNSQTLVFSVSFLFQTDPDAALSEASAPALLAGTDKGSVL